MEKTIRHLLENHVVNPETEILIVGTFNPNTPENEADFFYGRKRNYLWSLVPTFYSLPSLKNAIKEEKIKFIIEKKIDFVDLITAVNAEEGKEADYSDAYLDKRIEKETDVISLINSLKKLKKVIVTRKTFADVPEIKKLVDKIQQHCLQNNISFECVPTPARFYNQEKQEAWNKAFNL